MQISYFYSPNPVAYTDSFTHHMSDEFYDETTNFYSVACLAVCMDRRLKPSAMLCSSRQMEHLFPCFASTFSFSCLVFFFFFFFYVSYVKYPATAVRVRFQYGKYLGTVCTQESGMKERWFMGYIIDMDSVLIYHVKALA